LLFTVIACIIAAPMARPTKYSRKSVENVCSYCLFFQRDPSAPHSIRGNCTYHKEWIENASLTTCSDMSSHPLKEKGIYRLINKSGEEWIYARRQEKLRTRLFLVKGGKAHEFGKVKASKS